MEMWPRASQIIYVKLLCGGKMRPLTNHRCQYPLLIPRPVGVGRMLAFTSSLNITCDQDPLPLPPTTTKWEEGGLIAGYVGQRSESERLPRPPGEHKWVNIKRWMSPLSPGIQRLSPNLLKAWFCTITLHICTHFLDVAIALFRCY